MKIFIVFNHPYEGSFCSAILGSVLAGLEKAGHQTDLLHLDRDGFDPVMKADDLKGFTLGKPVDPKIIEYKRRMEQAEHLVLIFPIWWELMPALTKGFIDRVIFPGVAYDYDKRGRFPRMVRRFNALRGVTPDYYHEYPLDFLQIDFWQCHQKSPLYRNFLEDGLREQEMDQPEYG